MNGFHRYPHTENTALYSSITANENIIQGVALKLYASFQVEK